jgi:hypothetical protein
MGCGSMALADRGDRYGGDRSRGYDRGERHESRRDHDRGRDYSRHSRSEVSVGFGFSSGNYRGDRSYVDVGVNRSHGFGRPYYGGTYYREPVIVERPVYIAPPPAVIYAPPPAVIYAPAPTYYYESCPPITTAGKRDSI